MKQSPRTVSAMSNDGRNAYVMTQLTDTLVSMLAEKKLDDISISELCGRAGVGRVSFYRNYACKESILTQHISRLLREWADGWTEDSGAPLSEHIRALFAHFEKHRDFYFVLNRSGLIYLLKDIIIGEIGPGPDCPKTQAYAAAFVSYTIYGWIEVWFQRGMRESSDEIADMFKAQGL